MKFSSMLIFVAGYLVSSSAAEANIWGQNPDLYQNENGKHCKIMPKPENYVN